MDLSSLTNAPQSVEVAGQPFAVSHLTMREWGTVQGWIKANVPGPAESLAAINVDGLSPFAARSLMQVVVKEQQAWPPRVGSREWFDALDRVGKDNRIGAAVLLHTILAKHQPAYTYEQAERLYEAVGYAEALRLTLIAMGVEPDPKAGKPSPPETST